MGGLTGVEGGPELSAGLVEPSSPSTVLVDVVEAVPVLLLKGLVTVGDTASWLTLARFRPLTPLSWRTFTDVWEGTPVVPAFAVPRAWLFEYASESFSVKELDEPCGVFACAQRSVLAAAMDLSPVCRMVKCHQPPPFLKHIARQTGTIT